MDEVNIKRLQAATLIVSFSAAGNYFKVSLSSFQRTVKKDKENLLSVKVRDFENLCFFSAL